MLTRSILLPLLLTAVLALAVFAGAFRYFGSMAAAIRRDEAGEDVPDTLREAVAAFERELIGKAIRAHEGRKDTTAEPVGIRRRTLNEEIVKLGLDKDELL